MSNYYTPIDVARALTRHAPRNLSTVLEPAVGTGLLLKPLLPRLRSATEVVCIDKDGKALSQLKGEFAPQLGSKLEVIRTDFVKWPARTAGGGDGRTFDCVVMNPPFEGKRDKFVDFTCPPEAPGGRERLRRVAVEVAFVVKAVQLLKPGGRLLAIVPSSIITSLSTAWLREFLLREGAVRYVHELPRFTFEDVSARIYLFIFEKRGNQMRLALFNHDLAEPESLTVRKSDLAPDYRFDYGYHHARKWLADVKRLKKRLMWVPLRDVADVIRGDMSSPEGARRAIHTTNYKDGFWTAGDRKRHLKPSKAETGVRGNDILVKRVGRDCSRTFGKVTDARGYATSDCVLIVRPRNADSVKLLFAVRTVLGSEFGPSLLERGTGAPYLTLAELPDVEIPVNLSEVYCGAFIRYQRAVGERKFAEMLAVEEKVRKSLNVDA